MALIKCSECGKIFSDKAMACPNCACPTELIVKEKPKIETSSETVSCDSVCANDNTEKPVFEVKEDTKLVHEKNNLLSFEELKKFAFESVLPQINIELNGTITDVNVGRGNGDVDFYLTCHKRTIGIRVKVDAYPDVLDVGQLYGENKLDIDYAKEMYDAGYDFAIANIGIGSRNPVRFNRRIFLKEDEYCFKYSCLQFRDYRKIKDIRYSLSEVPADESWKEIADFEYQRSKKKDNVNSIYLIQRDDGDTEEKRRKIEDANWDMWRNSLEYPKQIRAYYDRYGITVADFDFSCEMFHYMAFVIGYRSNAEELMNYFYNAIDYVQGRFLRDSKAIPMENVLPTLKTLCKDTELMKNHDISTWGITAYNYLIYKYLTDMSFVSQCILEYKNVSDRNAPLLGFLSDVLKKEFRKNPAAFGYPVELKERIKSLEAKNSPEYYVMFENKKKELRNNMVQFALLHNRVIDKNKIREIYEYNINEMKRYENETYKLDEFIREHFDENLSQPMRRVVDAFVKEMEFFRISMHHDIQMIRHSMKGEYGFFEFRKATKESKKKYNDYFASKSVNES